MKDVKVCLFFFSSKVIFKKTLVWVYLSVCPIVYTLAKSAGLSIITLTKSICLSVHYHIDQVYLSVCPLLH